MKKLPQHIAKKVYQHNKYSLKAEELRVEIEEWFKKQDMKSNKELGISIGEHDEDMPITDILVDNGVGHDVEETIKLLELTLNDI
ncbi:hypothetical protein ACIQ1D_19260 [Lysinibacillus xylanilyticus]|uniref:hypothetical protein n=1 Tax=Lysinibacillus xylanilyticus TaxID=582475 RepID=UPI0037F1FDC2